MSIEQDENELSLLEEADENENNDNIVPSNPIASQTIDELENELNKFRIEWKKELLDHDKKTSDKNTSSSMTINIDSTRPKNAAVYHSFPTRPKLNLKNEGQIKPTDQAESDLHYEEPNSNEEKAKYLFDKGVILEQQGRHYEAIKFYRMSMQLDADIEFKMAANKQTKKTESSINKTKTKLSDLVVDLDDSDSENTIDENEKNDNENENENEKTLYEQFREHTISVNKFCEKEFQQKAIHFSDLPFEVITLILKWVVSEHLDMRSLDRFSCVCKGFYVCARDPEIWKLACAKIWGANNIANYLSMYQTWRQMYLSRPRLNIDGVYISKASYARAGEQSLDNFYRPWHLVEYYRYMRFFSDGTVLFLTSPDDPKSTVTKLKSGNQISSTTSVNTSYYQAFIMNEHSILKGKWTLALNKVSIVLVKKILKSSLNKPSRRQQNKEPILEQEHVFRMELELYGKMNNQLQWSNYEIDVINKITNVVNVTKFDLNKIDFPNFYFSRVKSYSTSSEMPLK